MLMVYSRLGYAIRPMQKRGERLFWVRREKVIGSIEKTRQTGFYTPFQR